MRGVLGLADLTRAVLYHVAFTSCLEIHDPLKFTTRTPADVLQMLERCWATAPSGLRIIEDISALPRVLHKVIEHESACSMAVFTRSRRRKMSMLATELTKLPRTYNRIATLAPRAVHVSVAHVVPEM
jgi:hypothetical protein